MSKKVKRKKTKKPLRPLRERVCIYARTASGEDAELRSLSEQVSRYSGLIKSQSDMIYAGAYVDAAASGIKEDRVNFQHMLNACRNGEIDRIITKSISQFSRNTVTVLSTVRELKSLGIDVYFEKENIHSINENREIMRSIFVSLAQGER